ncbi:MAG: adenosine deaminase [Clostridia bacterium]|nr:adenosine deaminase [Clostridia bacterium]
MKMKAKIELHCHLDGSLRPETVLEYANQLGVALPTNDVEMLKAYLVAPADCPSLSEYLKRFDLPIAIMQTEEVLERVAFELMEDCAEEGVKYIEIRFAPLFHQAGGLSVTQIIKSVLKGIRKAEAHYAIKGNLILSFLKFMPVKTIFPVLDEAKTFIGKGVVAVDLAGNEEKGFSHGFIDAMAHAKQLGYHLTIHAGETGFGVNVLEAIELLGAERIGHGVSIKDHEKAFELVKNRNIVLEMCPTSNVQTKAVTRIEDHPLAAFLEAGIQVTLNTDNRTVSDTTMTKEIMLCKEVFGCADEDYRKIYETSLEASFASEDIKQWLRGFL